ncbi:mechanosensitive ion channel family protein [Candidatus Nitronereus thalassa]|uniref:Mechanosensitive ion channel family protein n=1 Tax=Candidatus Nitronereus thalassa TaxID=3020898 RepID=A0ABU3K5U5_9BACT|nr:mechanosensitive ion channel family protein [Candidatus Nitronereus thalassa]MDT7041743.1 mechanosensitive ion channel family protein [Candidatus Nitronereus thalassa]
METQTMEQITTQLLSWLLGNGLLILVVLVAMFLGFTLLKRGLARLGRFIEGSFPDQAQIKRANTLTNVLGDLVRVLITGIGVTTILSQLGIDLGPLLVAAGIGGVAIGFGAQSLVKDVISGFFILLENQVRVGDVVNIAGVGGLVEDVGLRTISLRDLAGNVHIVPNGTISTVTNMTMGYSRYVFNVGVAYRENVDQVMSILKDVGAAMQNDPKYGPDILEPLEMLGVDSFADSAVVIKCRITTKPIQQWAVGREMNRRIKLAFDANGIEIPFPHRTIYWGEPKEGSAPPLNIHSLQTS